MSSLSACCPADFADAETGYSGLDHNELLRAAFPQSARWTEQQEKNIKRLLPEWDIGNSYLDDRQTRQLSDELKQCLRGSTVYDWPEKLYPPAPPKPSPPIAASGKMTASYWVSKLRDQPGWSTEFASQNRSMDLKPHDVFLSFATQDAEVVQGRQQLVQKIERWVNIRLERAGLGPIWNYLNQGQGARIGDNWVEPTVWHMATCKCCIIVASREYDAAEVTMKLELPFLLSRKLLEKDKFQLFVARATDHDIKNIQVSTFDGDDSFYPFGDLVDDRQYRQGIDPYPFNNYSLGELLEQGQSNIFEARIVALGDAIATWLSRRQN